jgi:hypothetical protein
MRVMAILQQSSPEGMVKVWTKERGVCQVFCVNDLDFVLGFGSVVALGFAVVVGFGDGVQGKGAFPLPLHIHVEENLRLHYANLPGLVMRSGHRTVK